MHILDFQCSDAIGLVTETASVKMLLKIKVRFGSCHRPTYLWIFA